MNAPADVREILTALACGLPVEERIPIGILECRWAECSQQRALYLLGNGRPAAVRVKRPGGDGGDSLSRVIYKLLKVAKTAGVDCEGYARPADLSGLADEACARIEALRQASDASGREVDRLRGELAKSMAEVAELRMAPSRPSPAQRATIEKALADLLAALPPVLGPGYTYTVKYLRATTIAQRLAEEAAEQARLESLRDRFFTVCRLVAGLDSAGRQDEIPETSLWSRP